MRRPEKWPEPWPEEWSEYLAVLVEVNPLATGVRITEIMSERFGIPFSKTTVQKKLIAIRGPRQIVATDEQKAELFDLIAKHSDLKFPAIAKLYSAQSGIEMDACMCRRWYHSVLRGKQ